MKRLTGLITVSSIPSKVTAVSVVLVNAKNKTKAPIAAGTEYRVRVFTTIPNWACWVVEEAMVVSEIGPKLSPNAAPETIAPIIYSGATPAITPTGNKIGITTK